MIDSELIAQVREEATIESESTEYTAAKIRQILNQQLLSVFVPIIADARSGYYLHQPSRTIGINNPMVRMHPRSTALEEVDIRNVNGNWCPLAEAIPAEATSWNSTYVNASVPQAYVLDSDYIRLLPAATDSTLEIKTRITVRAGTLVTEQSAGLISNADINTRIITVNAMPLGLAGTVICDAIAPRSLFELSMFNVPVTYVSPTTVSVPAGYDMTKIEAGDYLRLAGQFEWPQLPEEFHHLLAIAAAIPCCKRRDMYDREQALQTSLVAGVNRMREHMTPRTRSENHRPVAHGWT